MKLRYKYRIYPTAQQKVKLAQLFGCCRVVFNDALAYCQETFNNGGKYEGINTLSKRLTLAKKTKEKRWLSDVSAIPLTRF